MSNLSTLIYDRDLDDLQAWVQAQGQPAYRARQIWEGLYRHLWASPKDFTPVEPDQMGLKKVRVPPYVLIIKFSG